MNTKNLLCLFCLSVFLLSCKNHNNNSVDPAFSAERERLEAIQKNLPAPEDYVDTAFGVPFEMVFVPGGQFWMGGNPERDGEKIYGDEKPRHQVHLKSFYISRYEITQELWEAVMGNNPSSHNEDSRFPVDFVTWSDAYEFCIKLSLITSKVYRLPMEAQWEYAAQGGEKGGKTRYSGSDFPELVVCVGRIKPKPVGQYFPNELGIYDMSGNAWEWCNDWYSEYDSASVFEPHGPANGFYKVLRGGSWGSVLNSCRITQRSGATPDQKAENIGFRVVRLL